MANKDEDSQEKKVFDVAEPQDAKLDIGSKPMVIGHKSASDSTLANADSKSTETAEPEKETTEDTASAPSKKIRIEPLKSQEESGDDSESASTDSKGEEKKDSAQPPTEEKIDSEEIVKKDRDFAAEAENEEQTAQDAEAEREEKVEELKKSKKYHVAVKEKRDTAFGKLFAVLFAIIISIIGVYALADADIIPGGELLPTRFIGSNETINGVESQEVNTSNGVESSQETSNEDSNISEPNLVFSSDEIDEQTRRFILEEPFVSFNYPAEFGEVVQSEDTNEGRVYFSFSEESNFIFVLNEAGRIGPEGHDSPTLNLQSYEAQNESIAVLYLDPDTTTKTAIENATVLFEEEEFIIFETAGIGYVFAGIALFPDGGNYESIVFDYLQGKEDSAFTASDEPVQKLYSILETITFSED